MKPKDQLQALREIIHQHKRELSESIEKRRIAMEADDTGHYLLFRALGIEPEESKKIDLYQNIGRFVYRRAGSLLEELAVTALSLARGGEPIAIKNIISTNPSQFTIDCYVSEDNKAHEIKWRDATTDGDHVRKERDKLQCLVALDMIPVRVMFYYPQRRQAQRIQEKLLAQYREYGEAYVEGDAWRYIQEYTGYDLLSIIIDTIED